MIIQFIVIVVASIILLVGLVSKQTHSTMAWKKVILVLLAVAMVVAVIFPDITTKLAHLVGVGRGADLVLYTLALAFIGYIVNAYAHQQRDKEKLFKLARKVALIDASNRYNQASGGRDN